MAQNNRADRNKFSLKPWTKYIIEGFVIMFSILAAFWLDGYRDERMQLKREQEVKTALKSELNDVYSYSQNTFRMLQNRIDLFTKVINNWETLDPEALSEGELMGH